MIIEKLLNKDFLTENEKSIAAYLLDAHNHIENLTSLQLGEYSYTSQAAVVRLYKKLGLHSYREFLNMIILERNEYFKTNTINKDNLADSLKRNENSCAVIAQLYEQTMAQTNLLLDTKVLSRVALRLLKANMIDIYGVGISETLAKQLFFQLQSLGLNCCFHDGINKNYVLKSHHLNRVSILITLTGMNETVYHVAQLLKQKKIYTVLISGWDNQLLESQCDDVLKFGYKVYDDMDTVCSVFAGKYVIDVLTSTCLALEMNK